MRRSPRCTYPLTLDLEGNILDDCSITFPWSSARLWVPRGLAGPFARPLADLVRGRAGSGGMTGSGLAPPLSLLQARCGGPGSVAPARGM